MCEPVYHNTLPSRGATTAECGDIFLTGTKLRESICDAQRDFKKSEPAKELTDKFR